ncbi:YbdD/YjiX family protein [Actinomadura scrupuli]|uniref:YbdD/YjiX family protein n=1 Tax=Actinomadura scrupuli TaxID=559629 RepID=UPI003D9888FC
MSARDRLRTAWRLFREFSGERAYEIYLEHQRREHPGEPVLTEREFWRRHIDARDSAPRVGCC